MDTGLPVSSASVTAGYRNPNTGPSGGNNFAAAAAAALAAAAAASQQHFFNAAFRAAAASTVPPTGACGLDHAGSGGSNSPLSVQLDYTPETAEAKLIDYRHEKVAAFEIDGEMMMCLPQAYDLFLKNLVGGLHTVYTKLKRLEIAPFVCNVEQVRALRSIGAIQPGVNRCKLISCRDFDILYEDCASSSSRPGRPPKRSPIFPTSSAAMPTMAGALMPGGQAIPTNNSAVNTALNSGFGLGGLQMQTESTPISKRARLSETGTGSVLDKFHTAMNPMAGVMGTSAGGGGNALNPNQLFPLFPFMPQNFMLSQIPNSNLFAKWGEQFNASLTPNGTADNSTPVDATMKSDGGHHEELAQNLTKNASDRGRGERNASWTSGSGQGESDEFLKFSNDSMDNVDESINLSSTGNVKSMPNGTPGRRQTNDIDAGNGGSTSDDDDANVQPASSEDFDQTETKQDAGNDPQSRLWESASSSNGGAEASQLLRSMVDLGINAQLFGPQPGLVAAAVAAASQQSGRQRSTQFAGNPPNDGSHYSSVENILFSVLGLVQVAASTARMHEEQLAKEKVEAMKMYETEKQERSRLEQLLRAERHSRAVYLKRLRRERKQKTELVEKMRSLAEGKQNSTNTASSSNVANGNAAKSPIQTYSNRSSNSIEAGGVSSTKSMDGERKQTIGNDCNQLVNAGINRRTPTTFVGNHGILDALAGSRADPTESSYGDEARNAGRGGRTATLYVKHELS